VVRERVVATLWALLLCERLREVPPELAHVDRVPGDDKFGRSDVTQSREIDFITHLAAMPKCVVPPSAESDGGPWH
jgi:hypothetical protein